MHSKNSNENFDLMDILLDENNSDTIIIGADDGEDYSFEQVAVIPMDDEMYVILKPLDEIDGVSDDEAFVFKIVSDKYGKAQLVIINDDDIGDRVFNEYYRLLDEEGE